MTSERPLVAILDYGIGNLHSAEKGFAHVGADTRLTADPGLIAEAAGVVLPGVGAFAPCMRALRDRGLDSVVHDTIDRGVPFFGICIGMQVLFAASEEAPGVEGLAVFDEKVGRIPDGVKRPHMQWNELQATGHGHPMLESLPHDPWVYFVHSFVAAPGPNVVATTDYGSPLVAAVARDNVWACQFHPEKSGGNGLQILQNFVATAASGTATRDGSS